MIKEKILWRLTDIALTRILRYIDKKPRENLIKLINFSEKFVGKIFPKDNFCKI